MIFRGAGWPGAGELETVRTTWASQKDPTMTATSAAIATRRKKTEYSASIPRHPGSLGRSSGAFTGADGDVPRRAPRRWSSRSMSERIALAVPVGPRRTRDLAAHLRAALRVVAEPRARPPRKASGSSGGTTRPAPASVTTRATSLEALTDATTGPASGEERQDLRREHDVRHRRAAGSRASTSIADRSSRNIGIGLERQDPDVVEPSPRGPGLERCRIAPSPTGDTGCPGTAWSARPRPGRRRALASRPCCRRARPESGRRGRAGCEPPSLPLREEARTARCRTSRGRA